MPLIPTNLCNQAPDPSKASGEAVWTECANMSMSASQLNLFDTTVLSGELAALWSLDDDQPILEISVPSPQTFRIPQRDFRLKGVRGLAQGWKARGSQYRSDRPPRNT
ncbi:hypothetical protein AA18889_2581 [Acetobacter senegalensis DSM 18889]|nr:hypothetical protein AA18889_2581 [Acetobacter senegalensis DSM 18889]